MANDLIVRQEAELDIFAPLEPKKTLPTVSETEANQKAALTIGAKYPDVEQGEPEAIQDELLKGDTTSPNAVLQNGEARNTAARDSIVDDILLEDTALDQKQLDIQETLSTPVDTSLREEFAINANNQSLTRRELKDSLADYLLFSLERPALVRKLETELISYNPDTAVRDMLASFALPGYGAQFVEVLDEAMPGFANLAGHEAVILPGNMINLFREQFAEMSVAEKEDTLRRIAVAIEENDFFGMENGVVKHDLVAMLLGDFKPSTADAVLVNVISLMDLLALGEAVRMGSAAFRGIKNSSRLAETGRRAQEIVTNYLNRKNPSSPSSELDAVAPKEAKTLAEDITQGKTPAAAVNETDESITQAHILPEPAQVKPTAAPSVNRMEDEILGYDPRIIAFNEFERFGVENRALTRAESILSVAPTAHLNKMQIENIEGGIRSSTYIGLPDSGFPDILSAKNLQESIRGEFPTAEIHVRDGRTNELLPLSDVPKEHRISEYFLKFSEDLKYSADDATAVNPILPGGLTGKLAKFFTKSSYLDDLMSISGSVAGDVKAAKNKVLSEQLAPLTRLQDQDRKLVENLIDRGDQIGKEFTNDELMMEWGHFSERKLGRLVEAYEGFTRFQRTQWKLINDSVRSRLDGGGWKEVVLPFRQFDDQNFIGRRVEHIPDEIDDIYDPVADAIVRRDQDDTFLELRRPIHINGIEVTYVRNVPDQGRLVINQLPPEVIKNVPGRIPRLYDVTHIVKKVVPVIRDGKSVEARIPVKMAKNRGEAEASIAELQKADPDSTYRWFEADELREDLDYANRTSLDYFEDSGQLWLSDRGMELDAVDGTRPLKPVLDRLSRAREHASRIDTLDLVAEKWVKNWEREFGQEFGVEGRMPSFDKPILPNDYTGKTDKGLMQRRLRDAIAFRDHIGLVTGLNSGLLQREMRQSAIYVAEKIATPDIYTRAGKARNWAATKLLEHRNFDPVNLLKQVAFYKFIIGNPIRQLALQSQQATVYLGVEHGSKYFLSGKGVRDWQGLTVGMMMRDNPATWDRLAPGVARGLGMNLDEYTEFVDAMKKSGLIANIDSHAFTAGMLTDKTFGGGEGFVKSKGFDALNGAVKAARLMRKLGFDAGEGSQLTAAFLAKRNEWIKNNPTKSTQWAQTENLAEIAGGARQISFEMTREGALAFQKGLLGAIFQFASHNFKATQALLPNTRAFGIGKLSNKAFNNKQKAAIAAGQLSYYGLGGFGLYEGWDQLKAQIGDVPEEVDLLVKEGLFGSLVTSLVAANTNEPFDVDISGSLAPFSGVFSLPIYRILGDATAFGMFDIRNIPGATVANDVKESLEMIGFLTGAPIEALDLNEFDRVTLIVDEIARNVPIYNKFMKARAELAIERLISNSGDPKVQANRAEILAGAMLGIRSEPDRQLFDIRTELEGRRAPGSIGEGAHNAELKEYASAVYENTMKILQRTGDNEANIKEALRFTRAIALTDRELLTDFEYRRVHKQLIPDLMYSKLRKGTDEAELIKLVESKLNSGAIETTDTVLRRIGQSKTLRDHERIAEWLKALGE